MTFQSIITVLILIIAIYNILPKYRRLELTIKFTLVDIFLISLSILAIHYLLFYNFFVSQNLNPALNLNRWGITPANVSYLLALIIAIYIFLRYKHSSLPSRNIVKFRELVEDLSNQSKYSELLPLIEKNLSRLIKIYNGAFLLGNIRTRLTKVAKQTPVDLSKLSPEEINELSKGHNKTLPGGLWGRIKKSVVKTYIEVLTKAANIFPSYFAEKECVREIFQITLLRKPFVKAIIRTKPYFGIKILELNILEKDDFKNNYFRELIADSNSILYLEIKQNQNTNAMHRYHLPKSNKLLNYLFQNAKNAEKLLVWNPIGEQVIYDLDKLYKDKELDYYNMPLENFQETACWESSIYVGIRFFDIMVTEALYQNIVWHMWLFYFRPFVQRICRNFDPCDSYVNLNDEFPTKYNYLLYEIFSTLRSWIRIIKKMPKSQSNSILESTSLTNENGNIIKSSIITLGQCIQALLATEKMPIEFKDYMLAIAFDIYFDLKSCQDTADYSDLIILSILCGGAKYPNVKEEHIGQVISSFLEYDTVPKDSDHVESAFNKLIQSYISNYPESGLQKWGKLTIKGSDIVLKSSRQGRGYTAKNVIS